jgi:hypothetical protein
MKNRTLQVLLLALTGIAATAHCGKSESSGTPSLGPTDVVVTWTFDGKAASAAECTARGGVTVSVTMSATSDPTLHQHSTESCEKGTVTFSGLNTGALGQPFVEATLLDDKGLTKTRADMTVTPVEGKTEVKLDFFPSQVMTTGATTGDATTDAATTDAATTTSGGMGGMGGMGSSAASSASASAAGSGSSATATGAGGGKP